MLKMKMLLVVSIFLAVVATNCHADERGSWNFKDGDSEIAVSGSFSGMDLTYGSTMKMLSLAGSYGYFFSEASELSIKGMGIWGDIEGMDISFSGLGIDYKLHFTSPGITPYGGIQYVLLSADIDYEGFNGDADGAMYGPMVGLKYFVTESVLLTGEFQYQLFNGDIGDVIDQSAQFSLGMSFKY